MRESKSERDHRISLTKECEHNRQLALERDGHKCRKCGSTDHLHVHHLEPYREDQQDPHRLENLQTLCASCHLDGHRLRSPKRPHGPIFSVAGISRKFSLYKFRGRNGWQVAFTPPKRARFLGAPNRIVRTLQTTIVSVARERATQIIESYWKDDGVTAEKLKHRSCYPTIGELLSAYEPSPDDVRPATKWRNKSSLRKVVRDVLGIKQVENARCDVLTEALADKFLAVRANRARAALGANPVTIERAKVSANSTLNQARSVVGKNAIRLYRDKFKLPDFSGFRTAKKLKVARGYFTYRRTAASVISAIDRDAQRIKTEQPHVYRAYVLMRYLGLRPSEVWPARWDWIDREQGQDVFRICRRADFTPKAGDRDIPIASCVMGLLDELRGSDHPSAWIIGLPTVTEREHVVHYDINRWLRYYIPRSESQKCSYNLRKHCGSEIADRYGIEAAAAFLGDTIAITEKHYAAKARIPAGIELAAAAMG